MTKEGAIPVAEIGPVGPILDVWSRTARRYRVRAALMLLLLAALFGGLCCFMFWLRTGTYLPWREADYRKILIDSFRPAGAQQYTLIDFLDGPIPIREVPVHAAIIGLQLAAMMSIPVLIAILYRLPAAVPFAAMIALLAAMPWLGITVMCGCVLACMGRFRFRFRLASALVGLAPCVAYFVMASWEPNSAVLHRYQPEALIYAPWVLALLGSCVIFAVALAIARIINYRPGGIPPVLAALFAIPAVLFHSQVGRDELRYRILESDIGPGSASDFAPVDLAAAAKTAAAAQWSESDGVSLDSIVQKNLSAETQAGVERSLERLSQVISDCDGFIEQFPNSRHVAHVLLLKARAQNCRVDETALHANKRLEFRFDRPALASRRTYLSLVQRFAGTDIAAPAFYHLADFEARDGDFDEALSLLEKLSDQFEPDRADAETHQAVGAVFDAVLRKAVPARRLGIDVGALKRDARTMREMLIACRGDAPKPLSSLFGPRSDGTDVPVNPVQLLLWLDESSRHYRENLEGIVAAFPDSETAGYVQVRLAAFETAPGRRIAALQQASAALQDRAAGAEAAFRLAEALLQDATLEEAQAAFEAVVASYPDSAWSEAAGRRLEVLGVLLAPEPPDSDRT